MGKTASNEKRDRSRPWQRAATRAAILAAARRLIARAGIDNLSLTAVAREAQFAPATVFAYFSKKDDLFLSVLADDLATFARTMQHASEATEENGATVLQELSLPAETGSGEVRPVAKLRLVDHPLDREESSQPVVQPAVEPVTPSSNNTEPAPADVSPEGLARELARLQAAVARLESCPVDQWLERRLREFERGLTALEARPEKAEAAATLAAMDETLRTLRTRVEAIERGQTRTTEDLARAMRERGEQIEKRLREFLSDIEAVHRRAAVRLDALENAAFAVVPQFFQTGAGAKPANPQTGAVAETISPGPVPDTAPVIAANAPAASGDKSYLSAARRSAMAAAELGEQEQRAGRHARRMSKRSLYVVAACLGLVVALIWTGVYFKALAVPSARQLPERTQQVAKAQKVALRPDVQSTLMEQARSGNAKAQLVVALDLLDGPQKNDVLAARWLLTAARQGEAFAAFELAMLYRSGHGVPLDARRAFHWFEAAAHKGNRKAMQDLAVAYAEGWGTGKDGSEAARWFTRAASLGLTDAQFNLGVLYEQGLGVPQSLSDAYKWYLVAAGEGDRQAAARVETLKPLLPSSEIAAAEEAAASFKPAPLDRDANVAPQISQFSAS